ncbi:MAG TPA: O-antigen ligase family protein [Syntrophales bacterium]|nr:O-antigen ligase family protein [Syntrophales bacterium]
MERAAFGIYVFVLVASPVLFGAVHTWAYATVFLLILAASLLLIARDWLPALGRGAGGETCGGEKRHLAFLLTGAEALFVLMVFLLVVQMTPLPGGLLTKLSAEAKAAGLSALPATASVADPSLKNAWFALAPYAYPVRMSLIRWTAYGLLFFGLCRTLNSRRRIELLVVALLATAVADALYGIVQTYSGSPHVLWWKKLAQGAKDVSGTYINRNHFAGFMEMGIALAIAYAGAIVAGGRRQAGPARGPRTLKDRFIRLFSGESRALRQILVVFSGVVMGVALILSASRGGIVSALAGLFVMGVFFLARRDHRAKGGIVLALFGVTVLYAAFAGMDYTIERFQKLDFDHEGRPRYMERAVLLHDDYPLAGVGVGNFRHAYPKYQAPEDRGRFIDLLHSDWMQFYTEAGYAGMLALIAGLGWFVSRLVRTWSIRGDPFAVCLGLAPVGALAALGTHSLFDFNLHIPANFMMLVAVCAIGLSALHLERQRREDVMRWRRMRLPLAGAGGIAAAFVIVLIAWTGLWTVRHAVAEAHCATVGNLTMNLEEHQSLDNIRSAIAWDGANAEYHWNLARELMDRRDRTMQAAHKAVEAASDGTQTGMAKSGAGAVQSRPGTSQAAPAKTAAQADPNIPAPAEAPPPEASAEDAEPAKAPSLAAAQAAWRASHGPVIAALEGAIRLNPLDAEPHVRLAWEYTYLWDRHDYMTRWMRGADASMERAAYYAGTGSINPHLHVDMGNYWAVRSKNTGPGAPPPEISWLKASWHYGQALALTRQKTKDGMKPDRNVVAEITNFVRNLYPDDPARLAEALGRIEGGAQE